MVQATVESADKALKVYTGAKSDAFFIGREQFGMVTQREGFIAATKTFGNLMERINILSIALEIYLKPLSLVEEGFLTVSAESFTTYEGYKRILDRVGRPEITNLSLHDITGGQAPVKRAYNQMSLSSVRSSTDFKLFKDRLVSNIGAYDFFDDADEPNWGPLELDALTETLLDDYLVLDLSKTCSPRVNNYLDIERSLLRGAAHYSCGGRKLTDDMMSTMYALYIGGPSASLGDYATGVSAPYRDSDKELSADFPYLAAPEPTGRWTINLKRAYLNSKAKKDQE